MAGEAQLLVYIDIDLKKRLKMMAVDRNITLKNVVSNAFDMYLEAEETDNNVEESNITTGNEADKF